MAARPSGQGEIQLKPFRAVKTPSGSYSELPLQTFFDRILPPLRYDLHSNLILGSLKKEKKAHKILTQQNRWRGFARDPKFSGHSAYDTFKHLEPVVRSISDASNSDSNCARSTIRFQSTPKSAKSSSDVSFPDASFLEGSELDWSNIAVCGEYQTGDVAHGVRDSTAKVIASMASCMRNDLRRRFVLGFTIQDTEMRLWLCDRCRILVSRPFNFIMDHLSFIRFCLSIIYAQPHELGWDTTMKPLQDGHNFDVSVKSVDGLTRTYRTQSMLSSRGPRVRLGKGTKVWNAVRLENGEETGPSVVLKDCWVSSGYTREGDIIRHIRRDALISEDENIVKRVFLDTDWHGDVFIGEDEPALDRTVTFAEDELSDQPIRGLVHYRLVLTPVCQKNIEHETSVPVIYNALAHAAEALQLMHKAGWVHRDVSTGNILLGDQPRLVDFEYAKQAGEDEDLAIGTRFFKAMEVDIKCYAFEPPVERKPQPTMDMKELLRNLHKKRSQLLERDQASQGGLEPRISQPEVDPLRERPEALAQDETAEEPQPGRNQATSSSLPERHPLRYNPLHDLESLWWVAVYFLLRREVQSEDPDKAEDTANWDREKQRKWADDVFHSTSYRIPIMSSGGLEYYIMPVVHPTMRPVVHILEDLRQCLVQRYRELEKDPASIDFSCAEGIHELFMVAFLEIEQSPVSKDVVLVPLATPVDAGLSLYENVAVPEPPKPQSDLAKNVDEAQKGKETRKGLKTRWRRKITTVTPVHRYNLRPRTKRS